MNDYEAILGASAMLSATVFSSAAYAQASADDANKSNNPLNLAPSFNLQNYYTPSLFGVSAHTPFAGADQHTSGP
jgi:hypothetical protein